MKKKRRKIKENTPGAVSCHMFVSRRAQHREKAPPPRICEQEGVPHALSESQQKKEKKRGGCIPKQRHVPE
jgi:hypothetical protein